MQHTLKQRSALVRAAERALSREPEAILGDRIVLALSIALIVGLVLWGAA